MWLGCGCLVSMNKTLDFVTAQEERKEEEKGSREKKKKIKENEQTRNKFYWVCEPEKSKVSTLASDVW